MSDQRDGGIAWCDESWNPIRGCSRISEGCRNCYAESVARRFSGPGQPYEGLVTIGAKGARWNGTTKFVVEHLADPLRWKRPRLVFVNSMSDLFHESLTNEQIAAVFGVMAASPTHTFQVLTKRPERMREWFASNVGIESMEETVAREGAHLAGIVWDSRGSNRWKYPDGSDRPNRRPWPGWPLPNVWLGVSVEDQASAEARIPPLLDTPAAVRWVSYEPAIGPVDFNRLPQPSGDVIDGLYGWHKAGSMERVAGLDWIVVGGESGPGARPFDLAWARSVIEQTRGTGCRVFVKQLGAKPFESYDGPTFEQSAESIARHGEYDPEVPEYEFRDRKGGDPTEWPEDLRVREWPEVARG